MKRTWDERANGYDDWYLTFRGAVEHSVDWELLQKYLPKDKKAHILDAAGGTGRMTLPLAKRGYSVTLCDISSGMLSVAKQKVRRERLSDSVQILQCDVRRLPLAKQSFDFVLCWDGGADAAEELIRVAKKGATISTFLVNRWAVAIDRFQDSPEYSLSFTQGHPTCLEDRGDKHIAVSPPEASALFKALGVKVLALYAVYGWLDALGMPEKVLQSRRWDQELFIQTKEMALRLSQEPSVKGLSRHLVLYGQKM